MKSKTVIIQGSSRSNGDTQLFSRQLAGSLPAEVILLNKYKIGHYSYEHTHAIDDFLPLIKQLMEYQHWVIATPVYWYTMSGYTKVFLDRFSDLLQTEKALGRQLRGKTLSVLSVSNEPTAPNNFYEPLKLSAEYLGMSYLGQAHAYKTNSKATNTTTAERLTNFVHMIKSSDK